MANSGELEDGTLVSSTVLETLGDSQHLIFVFGLFFQSPLKEFTHSVCRELVVSFRIVPNNWLVQPVS